MWELIGLNIWDHPCILDFRYRLAKEKRKGIYPVICPLLIGKGKKGRRKTLYTQ